jgi:hypothetical protein
MTICEAIGSDLAEPMRRDCIYLTEAVIPPVIGWPREQPIRINAALAKWLAAKRPTLGRRQAMKLR